MRRTATLEKEAPLHPPRPRSVNGFLYFMVWICTFQVTGRSILMTHYFLYGSQEARPPVVVPATWEITVAILISSFNVVLSIAIAIFAFKQLKRNTRLTSERVFYLCVMIMSCSIFFEFYRHRFAIQVTLGVEMIRAALSWIATGASIVLIWRRRTWEAYVEAQARHRRTRKAVACAHEAEH